MITDIDKLAQQMREAAAAACSDEKWFAAEAMVADTIRFWVVTDPKTWVDRVCAVPDYTGRPAREIVDHIAAAHPAAVLALLDDRERLREELAEGEREKAAARGLQIGTAEVLAAKERECEELRAALREARDALNGAPNTVGLHAQIKTALATSGGGNG